MLSYIRGGHSIAKMTLSKVHARIQEEKRKLNPIDGRRFNSRSREKMEREIRVIKKSACKLAQKNAAAKQSHRGIFSQEEIAFAKEEKQKFREQLQINKKSVLLRAS
ncbi:EsV-1-90 [Ectocarpus siliculosus virus 1]|uniref:EsV-1-90 n=1 Tax=Ectocarpus siliculosus virus 1 (isolate New Zealand/Kaikoura/1988) TaxID=654926 RepID=Q8QNI7_ESV1K|nr:EsV-1-90 [Ectocarpus siliculosus virus 1]AAK14508.1 EsV-1-90 [Ectocarpus siliculosus virus 1]